MKEKETTQEVWSTGLFPTEPDEYDPEGDPDYGNRIPEDDSDILEEEEVDDAQS